MLALAFVRWWYGAGWKLVTQNVTRRMERTAASFSVPTLLRTMFAPWKRIVSAPGSGIDAHLRAMGDNAISRLVGFTVRLTVLFAAGICLFGLSMAGLLQFILWPLIPLLSIGLLVGGLIL